MVERLEILSRHLTAVPRSSHFKFEQEGVGLEEYRKKGSKFNPELLRKAVDGSIMEYATFCLDKAMKLELLTNSQYIDMPRAELRELYVRQILAYFKAVQFTLEQDEADGRKIAGFLTGLWVINQGLAIRLSVHLILYADTIKALGSEKHRPFVERAFKLQDYGSFSMTELGHGSNASGIETTATYDHVSREFILHTPNSLAAKWWIGAVGKTANMSVVFAKLILNGVNQGVHVFLVPIRNYETHEPMPGVVMGDCGPKEGCHGIDNGFLIFTNYRVPYDALLDKFSHLSMDGKLKTSMKNKDKRFAAMLGGLIRGRLGVSSGALISLRNGLTIAIRYAANRTQFGHPNKPEVSILDYQITRVRLMPHLANYFAAATGMELLRNLIEKNKAAISDVPDGPETGEVHALMSIFKPLASWYTQRGLQECRELTAGHGYSAFAGLSTLLNDSDVNITWEGENNVLLQQTSKYIFKNIQNVIKGQRIESEFLSFLSIDASHTSPNVSFASKDQLRDNLPLLRKMMEHRTNFLVRKSMLRLQENGVKYGNMLDTWNNTQTFFLHTLACSFGEMVLANEISRIAEITKTQCPETGVVLTRLSELYILSKVVSDLGTFREGDFISSDQGNVVKDYFLELCNEVAENSVRVIDAVAFPDRLIGSPFAVSNGHMYKAYTDLVENAEACYQPPTWVPLLREARKAL